MKNTELLVMGYVAGWAAPLGWTLEAVDWNALTHIIDTFAIPDATGKITTKRKLNDKWIESLMGKELVTQAHAKGVNAMVSFGGAKGSDGFALASNNPTTRKKLIENILQLVDEYGYDGIDIDWEYPTAAEKESFMLLMKELYTAVKKHHRKDFKGQDLLVTFFTTAGLYDDGVDWALIGNYIDYAIQSGYQWSNPYNGPLRNTGTYEAKSGRIIENSIDGFAQGVIQRGLPKEKFILGLPLYARPGKEYYNNIVTEGEFLGYDELQAEARYLHKGIVQHLNTPQAYLDKMAYVKETGRPGIAMWQLTDIYPRVDIWEAIKKGK